MDAAEIREETRKALEEAGSGESDDLSYIDDEYVEAMLADAVDADPSHFEEESPSSTAEAGGALAAQVNNAYVWNASFVGGPGTYVYGLAATAGHQCGNIPIRLPWRTRNVYGTCRTSGRIIWHFTY